jgi:hypothetical protein
MLQVAGNCEVRLRVISKNSCQCFFVRRIMYL